MNNARELRSELDSIADVDWRHPSWWALVGATALLESSAAAIDRPHPDLERSYLHGDGSPRSDTFIGRRVEPSPPAARIARAVTHARALVRVLADEDGHFPDQPLCCTLQTDGWIRRVPLPLEARRRVAFVTENGVFVADVTAAEPPALARSLAAAAAGAPVDVPVRLAPVDPADRAPLEVAGAVSLLDEDPRTARHLHRRAWTRGGGPWLGVGLAPPYEVVTTCHMVVDGLGHTVIADAILASPDHAPDATRRAIDVAPPRRAAPPACGSRPLGVAAQLLPGSPRLPELAYALGRTLARWYPAPGGRAMPRHSPTFQIPVAPGPGGDPRRLRRRVEPALVSVRRLGDTFEPLSEFRPRLRDTVSRQMRGEGILSRMLRAASDAPLPTSVKRRLLASGGAPHPHLPAAEVLAGRGCLSLLPAPGGPPMVAVSSPALDTADRDPLGGTVLTLVRGPEGTCATVSGTGIAGDAAGAARFLADWLAELERLERSPSRASR